MVLVVELLIDNVVSAQDEQVTGAVDRLWRGFFLLEAESCG